MGKKGDWGDPEGVQLYKKEEEFEREWEGRNREAKLRECTVNRPQWLTTFFFLPYHSDTIEHSNPK